MRRITAIFLLLTMLTCLLPACAEEAAVTPQQAYNSVRSTKALINEFFRNTFNPRNSNGASVTLLDPDGNELAGFGFSPFHGRAYLSGTVLPDLLNIPAEAVGFSGQYLAMKKDGQVSAVQPETLLTVLLAKALGLDPEKIDFERDAALLSALAPDLASRLAGLLPAPETDGDGRIVLTFNAEKTLRGVLEAFSAALSAHRDETDAFLARWAPVVGYVLPNLEGAGADELISMLDAVLNPESGLTVSYGLFDASLAWGEGRTDLSVVTEDDRFEARARNDETFREYTVTLNRRELFRFSLHTPDNGPYSFTLNAPGLDAYGAVTRMDRSALSLDATVNGTRVTGRFEELENGYCFTLNAGEGRFYGAITSDRFGPVEFFRRQRGGFNLILCYNAYTLKVTAGKGKLQIRADGARGAMLDAEIGLNGGGAKAVLDIPFGTYSREAWTEYALEADGRSFSLEKKIISADRHMGGSETLYRIAYADETPALDPANPVIAEHANVTSLTLTGARLPFGLKARRLVLTTDLTDRYVRTTRIEAELPDGVKKHLYTLVLDYSGESWPFDGEQVSLLTVSDLSGLFE